MIRRERVGPSLRWRSTAADTMKTKSAKENEDAEAEMAEPEPDHDTGSLIAKIRAWLTGNKK
jgi:hypothetical protein